MEQSRKEFEQIVGQYGEKLYWQIRRMVLNHDDANDVLQNTFIKAWNGLPQFEGRSSLSSWLYRIAINEALEFLRKKKQFYSLSDEGSEECSIASRLMADEYFDGDETAARLQQAIGELPHMQKLVFQLKYFENKKYSEISEILGKSEGALKASYHIAVKKISAFFEQYD
ncbi:RNA polymerase sigma factor [Palleniella muris]|uniref:RNA polymerase sigma factor n=1 Tax=Palleniella muris TaxID=3038145 RepID=A0AC61QS83_9BACT|nr:RNA polymerase sigma factor [Palleniella muris]TGX83328.1 RNA polymerase sigma factor [Palleniella muris]